MSKSKLILGAGIAALALAAASPAGATVGYFSNGFDTESKSMSGIGVSMGDGPVAAANNPALGVKLGNQAGACLSLFSPHRDLNITGGPSGGGQYVLNNGKYDSGKDLFEIPCAGVNVSVNDSTAVGLMLYANGGMNTHFSANPMGAGFGQASSPYGSDIEQVFVSANGAHAAGNGFTLGLAPIFAVQRMNMQGFQAFNSGSSAPGFVTNNGYDYSYGGGAKLGVLYDPVSWLTLGTSYQTHIWMTAFDMYKGLFAEAGKFDVPPTWTQGLTVRPTTGLDVSFEHETIYYGDIPSIANPGMNNNNPATPLGNSQGAGFGWKNMQVWRLGAQWKATDDLTLRTGYSYNTTFTDGNNAFFNTVAPATVKNHLSFGGTYDLTPAWAISVGYTHAFSNTLSGINQNSPTQSIKLHMDQDEGTIGVKYKW